ncbi:hypothetical protein [Mucilaginibacter sp.]
MNSIYLKIDHLPLKIVPDVTMAMNGHPVLTFKYYLFRDIDANAEVSDTLRLMNQQLSMDNGNYYGFITFDNPGQMFTYTSNGRHELETEEVEQIIEQVTHYREHPELWNKDL